MAAIYSPQEHGFDARLTVVDRCQIALLRELSMQHGHRLILKGGMAMRAVFGSLRLTKDIDFDRHAGISQPSLEGGLIRSLNKAARMSLLQEARAEITKSTATTVRARLVGLTVDGVAARFDVEVSGRGAAPVSFQRAEMIVPPREYGMAPFQVCTYTNEVLAAMKIHAALSVQRNAPRDLYDLWDLVCSGVSPTPLLARQPEAVLQDFAARCLGKLEGLSYGLARDELLPYLPQHKRDALTEDVWLEQTLMVAAAIESWCQQAIDMQHQPDAGRSTAQPVELRT
jgi:predicted nucleotidyltransferase component of viral defense system